VLCRRREHLSQQVAVTGLQFRLFPERHTSPRDPLGERVARALELLEAGNPGLTEVAGNTGVQLKARKSLYRETGQLMLEAGDLTAQLNAREALVASRSKLAERVSIEQIRHIPLRV
jgi:hypothetical protein